MRIIIELGVLILLLLGTVLIVWNDCEMHAWFRGARDSDFNEYICSLKDKDVQVQTLRTKSVKVDGEDLIYFDMAGDYQCAWECEKELSSRGLYAGVFYDDQVYFRYFGYADTYWDPYWMLIDWELIGLSEYGTIVNQYATDQFLRSSKFQNLPRPFYTVQAFDFISGLSEYETSRYPDKYKYSEAVRYIYTRYAGILAVEDKTPDFMLKRLADDVLSGHFDKINFLSDQDDFRTRGVCVSVAVQLTQNPNTPLAVIEDIASLPDGECDEAKELAKKRLRDNARTEF